MPSNTPPHLACLPLRAFDANESWDALDAAFAHCPVVRLGQGWRKSAESRFRPATVRVGWTNESLWFLARLDDDDMHNTATRPNERTWELGDVFEMFVRRVDAERYFEVHVTPENQTLQLELPHPLTPIDWTPPGLHDDLLEVSRTRVETRHWLVLAGIRFDAMGEKAPANGEQWLFSCSRYDYTRGEESPIYSSTSPHQEVNFHDQSVWGTLTFEGANAPLKPTA